MKYEIYKLLRNWTFWLIIFLSSIFTIAYSAIYISQSEYNTPYWYHSVREYSNDDDIQKQIDDCIKEIAELEEAKREKTYVFRDNIDEEIKMLSESVKILGFLKGKTDIYSFNEICDGCELDDYNKNARSYSNGMVVAIVLFQIVAMIFSVGQIVNQDKTSGAFAFSVMIKGRKKLFCRQSLLSFGVFTVSFLIQWGLVGTVRMFLDHRIKYAIYFNEKNVIVFSELLEYFLHFLSIYLLLTVFWAVTFFVSQAFDNTAVFSVAAIVSYAVMFALLCIIDSIFTDFGYYFVYNLFCIPGLTSPAKLIIALAMYPILIALCILGAYFISKKKNYRVRYE